MLYQLSYEVKSVRAQSTKCMVWRLGENTILLIIYVGEGLCKNMGPTRHVCIVFTSNQPMVMYSLANRSGYA